MPVEDQALPLSAGVPHLTLVAVPTQVRHAYRQFSPQVHWCLFIMVCPQQPLLATEQ